MTTSNSQTMTVEDEGERLDRYLAGHMDECTRSRAARLIRNGAVLVDGAAARASHKVHAGETIEVTIPPPPDKRPAGEAIPLDVLFEDNDIIVVNKAVGMVVHPAPGNMTGTLVNAVMYRWRDAPPTVGDAIRPGIVHRLDKNTSGVMVVARTERAYQGLVKQIRDRTAVREYVVLVEGVISEKRGEIDAPVGRSAADRKRMAVTGVKSREALTRFEVAERFEDATLVHARLQTGRTHQIRVHMAFIGHAVVGDPMYGRRGKTAKRLDKAGVRLDRQALHAARLTFVHPATGEQVSYEAPMPDDMKAALETLRTTCES